MADETTNEAADADNTDATDAPAAEETPAAESTEEAAAAESTDDAAEPAAEADDESAAEPAADAAGEAADASEDAPDPGVLEEERERQEMLAQILGRAEEGDREAVAQLEDEDLRRIAREKAAQPGKELHYISTGRRKRSIARVILTPGDGSFEINGRPLEDYFPRFRDRAHILEPLQMIEAETAYHVKARLSGGGVTGQAGALRHGVARALAEIHPTVRRQLKKHGFLKLDTRQVERKKAGLKKARKRPQFSKR